MIIIKYIMILNRDAINFCLFAEHWIEAGQILSDILQNTSMISWVCSYFLWLLFSNPVFSNTFLKHFTFLNGLNFQQFSFKYQEIKQNFLYKTKDLYKSGIKLGNLNKFFYSTVRKNMQGTIKYKSRWNT